MIRSSAGKYKNTEMSQGSTLNQMHEPANGRKLMLATVLTLVFAGFEAATVGVRLPRSAERRRTHGHRRGSIDDRGARRRYRAARAFAEAFFRIWTRSISLVAALVNGLFMLAVVATIIIQAVSRFTSPIVVQGEAVTAVASLGLLLNIVMARKLSLAGRDLTVREAPRVVSLTENSTAQCPAQRRDR